MLPHRYIINLGILLPPRELESPHAKHDLKEARGDSGPVERHFATSLFALFSGACPPGLQTILGLQGVMPKLVTVSSLWVVSVGAGSSLAHPAE